MDRKEYRYHGQLCMVGATMADWRGAKHGFEYLAPVTFINEHGHPVGGARLSIHEFYRHAQETGAERVRGFDGIYTPEDPDALDIRLTERALGFALRQEERDRSNDPRRWDNIRWLERNLMELKAR